MHGTSVCVTRSSGIVSSVADVLGMSLVRAMRGVGGVYVFGSGSVWGENPVGTGGVLDVCLCLGCGGVGEEWVRYLNHGLEGWGGVMSL